MIKISSTLNGTRGAEPHTHHQKSTDALVILANALAYDSNARVVDIVIFEKTASILVIRAPAGVRVVDASNKKTPALKLEGSCDQLAPCLQFIALLHEFGGSEFVMPAMMKELGPRVKKPVLAPELDNLVEQLIGRPAIVAAITSVVIYASSGEVKKTHITQAVHHAIHNLGCGIRIPSQ